ncbi:uncharacterized protein J3D65DRAFT_680018 [Phyllosticta citribraziliensis]|uniref:Uncharacterized protein n=1 Tax=Phyllosticta citribraziliensis TaxID=989973 RepID=A0ABR1LAF1_9PEZI
MVSPQQVQSSSQPSAARRLSLSELMYVSTSLARQGLAPGAVVTTTDGKPCSSSKQGQQAGDKGEVQTKGKSSKTKSKSKSSKGKAKGKGESTRLTKKQKQKKTQKKPSASFTPLPIPTSTSASPPAPPTASLAAAVPPPIQQLLVREYDGRDFCGSADALAAWMNARWAKTGYSVGSEAVVGVLRAAGRCGVAVGAGDRLGGVFVR